MSADRIKGPQLGDTSSRGYTTALPAALPLREEPGRHPASVQSAEAAAVSPPAVGFSYRPPLDYGCGTCGQKHCTKAGCR